MQIKKNQDSHLSLKLESEYEYSSLRLASIMFIPYIYLVLVGKYHIGKSYWLSCCGVWYSSSLEILPVLVKVLGEFVFDKIL